jgi:hypothetical protein
MEKSKMIEWIKQHKFLSFAISCTVLIILFLIANFLNNNYGYLLPYRMGASSSFDAMPMSSSSYGFGKNLGVMPGSSTSYGGGSYTVRYDDSYENYPVESTGLDYSAGQKIEIKQGYVGVKSEDAKTDMEILKEMVGKENGHIENSSKSESNTFLSVSATVRIPTENFDSFVKEIEANFELESFELSDYRVDIQREIDEMEIIKQSLEDYDFLREETLKMKDGEERINLLSRITREMQSLAQRQLALERELGGKQEKSDLATINFTFTQTLRAELWPDDLDNLFFDRINWGIETIATTAISLIANVFVLFIRVVEYILYAVIVIVPVSFAWRKIFRNKKKETVN